MLLNVYEGLYYCTHCMNLQTPGDGTCPWCALRHDEIPRHRVVMTERENRLVALVKAGEHLPISPRLLARERRVSVQARVEAAKAKGICAPLTQYALYWDVPGNVGKDDGVRMRYAYFDAPEGTLEVFQLEAGPDGRLFVHAGRFARWLQCEYHQGAIYAPIAVHRRWYEVDLTQYFSDGAMARTRKENILDHNNLSLDLTVMAVALCADTPLSIPGTLPKLGFEFGAVQIVPAVYTPTYRNFPYDEENMTAPQENPALAHTWEKCNLVLDSLDTTVEISEIAANISWQHQGRVIAQEQSVAQRTQRIDASAFVEQRASIT